MKLLQNNGHEVVLAQTGQEALDQLEKFSFDVVLMDVQMPQLDGLVATSIIREQERKSGLHVPIIATTAHAMKGDRERCLAAGMDGYLSKPIDKLELLRTIRSVLQAVEERARL